MMRKVMLVATIGAVIYAGAIGLRVSTEAIQINNFGLWLATVLLNLFAAFTIGFALRGAFERGSTHGKQKAAPHAQRDW